MKINRRALIVSGLSAGAAVFTPAVLSQTGRASRKLVIGQSVPLTGAADQIGLAYLNGAKLYFDAINAKNGAAGYKIEVKALDDGYNPAKSAANAKQLIDEDVDALAQIIRRQREMGLAIYDEVNRHIDMLERTDADVDVLGRKLDVAKKRAKDLR